MVDYEAWVEEAEADDEFPALLDDDEDVEELDPFHPLLDASTTQYRGRRGPF